MSASSIQINMLKPVPQFDHPEIPQYEEVTSTGIDKENKDKIDELERQL